MQVTWTSDNVNYHTGEVAGHQWFTISYTPWNGARPWWLASSIPVPGDLGQGACESVQEAKDCAQTIVDAFLVLVTPPAPEA